MTLPVLAFSLLVALAAGGARTADAPALETSQSPATVLARYARAIAKQPQPKAVSFVYAMEQLGPRDIAQTHRVYRSGRSERDETLAVDGVALTQPSIRILTNRNNRYAIDVVAPNLAAYVFKFSDLLRGPNGDAFVFRTEPRAARAFTVSEVEIDGHTYLPAAIRFRIAGNGAHGSGELLYGRTDIYWVVREARVSAHLHDGSLAREHIVWSNYQFPPSLPPSTFVSPRSGPTPEAALPTVPEPGALP